MNRDLVSCIPVLKDYAAPCGNRALRAGRTVWGTTKNLSYPLRNLTGEAI